MCLVEFTLMSHFNLNYLLEDHPDNSKRKIEAKNLPYFLIT